MEVSFSYTQEPLVELCVAPEIFVSGVAAIESIGGVHRIVFVSTQRDSVRDGLRPEAVVKARLVLTDDALRLLISSIQDYLERRKVLERASACRILAAAADAPAELQ